MYLLKYIKLLSPFKKYQSLKNFEASLNLILQNNLMKIFNKLAIHLKDVQHIQ